MWDTDVTNLALAVTSFAIASFVFASVAAVILIGLEELLLRALVNRAIVRNWMSGDVKVSRSPTYLLALLWRGITKEFDWAQAEDRLRQLTSVALYSLPQKQLCAQVAQALQLDWEGEAPGPVLAKLSTRYGQLPQVPSTSPLSKSPSPSAQRQSVVSQNMVGAERAIDDLETRLERTWSFLHYYGALLIVPTIMLVLRFEGDKFLSYDETLFVAVIFVASILVPVAHPIIERLRYLRNL